MSDSVKIESSGDVAVIRLDDGKAKIRLTKPRKWFEEGAPAAEDPSEER